MYSFSYVAYITVNRSNDSTFDETKNICLKNTQSDKDYSTCMILLDLNDCDEYK